MKPFWLASNGTVHAAGCEHARRLKVLSDWDSIDEAKVAASWDDMKAKVAPCARKVETR